MDDDDTVRFSGFIETIDEQENRFEGRLVSSVSCIDMHYLFDKRRIAASWESSTPGDIVTEIIAQLAAEGVTAGDIQTGGDAIQALSNYAQASDVMDALVERAGYMWWVDYDKQVYFVDPATYASPWTLRTNLIRRGSLKVSRQGDQYRNRQYVRGAKSETDPQTENHSGDSKARSFVVGYPIRSITSIKINGAEQTTSIKGLGVTADWYYSVGDPVLTQDTGGTLLGTSDTLEIVYVGEFRIVAFVDDPIEQARLAAIEGGTGRVEDVADDASQTSTNAALAVAGSKIDRYAQECTKVGFETRKSGLEAGQQLTVDIPEHDLDTTFMVESIELEWDGRRWVYFVEAIAGPEGEPWTRFWRRWRNLMTEVDSALRVGGDDVLIILAEFSKTWLEDEYPEPFERLYPAEGVYPAEGLFPTFKDSNVITYLAWYDAGGTEIGRKAVTTRTVTASTIYTVFSIGPTEAVGVIGYLGWFGGHQATATLGTGVLLEKVAWSHTKTALEAIQVQRTDTKGY